MIDSETKSIFRFALEMLGFPQEQIRLLDGEQLKKVLAILTWLGSHVTGWGCTHGFLGFNCEAEKHIVIDEVGGPSNLIVENDEGHRAYIDRHGEIIIETYCIGCKSLFPTDEMTTDKGGFFVCSDCCWDEDDPNAVVSVKAREEEWGNGDE